MSKEENKYDIKDSLIDKNEQLISIFVNRRLSENGFVARSSESFEGKATRPKTGKFRDSKFLVRYSIFIFYKLDKIS